MQIDGSTYSLVILRQLPLWAHSLNYVRVDHLLLLQPVGYSRFLHRTNHGRRAYSLTARIFGNCSMLRSERLSLQDPRLEQLLHFLSFPSVSLIFL